MKQADENADRNDRKTYCTVDELQLLLAADGSAVSTNVLQASGSYYHLVQCRGMLFETVTQGIERKLPMRGRGAVFGNSYGAFDSFLDYL